MFVSGHTLNDTSKFRVDLPCRGYPFSHSVTANWLIYNLPMIQ